MILFTLPIFYVFNYSQPVTLSSDNTVAYELPYPGILPDHPLYFVKALRDKLQDFFTRDNVKKAELYLLYSDKRLAMAEALAKKGKNDLSVTTLSKGEKYFLKIPDLLKNAKEQGSAATPEFVSRVRLSNQKHKELIGELIQEFPQGEQQTFDPILKMDDAITQKLQGL